MAVRSLGADARLLDRSVDHRQDPLDVSPGGDLRNDSAKLLVQGFLGCHAIAQHTAVVGDHRGGRFVTGRFDRQNWHSRKRHRLPRF